MIGKAEWFARRKYGGWGLHPKTWQGWAYVGVFFIVLLGFHLIPIWNTITRIVFTGFILILLLVDTIDIMSKLKLDERERIHEAIAERNALWGVIAILTAGVLYDIISSGLKQEIYVNPFVAIALLTALIIKSLTNMYFDKKN